MSRRSLEDSKEDLSLGGTTARTESYSESLVSSIRRKHQRRNRIDSSSSSSSTQSFWPEHLHIHPRPYQPSPLNNNNNNNHSSKIGKEVTSMLNELRIDSVNFHGRQQELKFWHEKIVKNHACQFVLISGPSGSGKSRLVHQFTSAVTSNDYDDDGDGSSAGSVAGSSSTLWAVGGKLDPRNNLPYSIFNLMFEDLHYAIFHESAAPADMEGEDGTTIRTTDVSVKSRIYSEMRSRCKENLSVDELKLLIKFIPALRPMLQVESLNDLEEQEAMRFKTSDTKYFSRIGFQFQHAFQKVVRIISKCLRKSKSRLVLVLDDLQWADKASLELLKMILTDGKRVGGSLSSSLPLSQSSNSRGKKVGEIIVVGCIRSEDFSDDHPLSALVQELEKRQRYDVIVHRLRIENLTTVETQSIVLDMMPSLDRGNDARSLAATSLAEIVQKKTKGNPLFSIHYVKELFDRERSTSSTPWDLVGFLDRVNDSRGNDMTSLKGTGVVDVVVYRFRKLPKYIQRLLPFFGALGSAFQKQIFGQVVNHFNSKMICDDGDTTEHSSDDIAQICIEGGLIEENGPEWYRWVNDTIQEATFSLIHDKERLTCMKYELASYLFHNLEYYELEQNLFLIANLFIDGDVVKHGESLGIGRQIELSRLYLQVGMRAIESSSFDAASSFLNVALQLLPQLERWTTHYELSLDLYSVAAQAEYCNGNFDAMTLYCDEVTGQRDRPLLDKQRVYNALLDSTAVRDGAEKASHLCLDLLSKIGCKPPKMGTGVFIKLGIMRSKTALKNWKEPSQCCVMIEPKMRWASVLLDKLLTFYFVSESPKLPFPVLKSTRWTEKYGVCESLLPAFASAGLLLAAYTGDFDAGAAYANRAIDLQEKFGSEASLARTYLVAYGLVLPWTTPYGTCRDQLLKGYCVGLKSGDIDNAFWCCLSSLCFSLLLGSPLKRLGVLLESCLLQLQRLNQVKHVEMAFSCFRLVLKLTGSEATRHDLVGETSYDDIEQLPCFHAFQLYVMFFSNKHRAIAEHVEQHVDRDSQKHFAGAGLVEANTFLGALSCLTMARDSGDAKYVKMARNLSEKVKTWTDKGHPNIVQHRAILDAEWAAHKNNIDDASHTFSVAIWMAERRGLLQDLALAHERCGDFYSSIGSDEKSSEHRSRAIALYEEWGASEIVRRIREAHPESNRPSPTSGHDANVVSGNT